MTYTRIVELYVYINIASKNIISIINPSQNMFIIESLYYQSKVIGKHEKYVVIFNAIALVFFLLINIKFRSKKCLKNTFKILLLLYKSDNSMDVYSFSISKN